MKDLTEFDLIEMGKRAASLVEQLDFNPSYSNRVDLEDEICEALEQAEQVQRDVESLCDHLRKSKKGAIACDPSK